MDFFERQDRARRKTKWLIVYFAMGVAGMVVAIYIAAVVIFSGMQLKHHRYDYHSDGAAPQISLWNPEILLGVSLGTLAIIGIGSAYKTMSLAAGGSAVSELMGGRLLKSNTTDPDERRLVNVVEEMSIASGVPMPLVYVIDDEHGINTFAAGHKPGDATITVTHGCLKVLSRDELQGVIGHEYSHILNGDIGLNLRLMGTIFGILCVAIIGRVLLQAARGTRGREPMPLILLGFVLVAVGYIGIFFGRLIQAAVSRQREFLADASSVQFTRNPGGITGALKKIGGLGDNGSRLSQAHSEELSHMFFSNGISEPFFGLLETHPPLTERIRAFEPNFDGKYPYVRYDGLEGHQPDRPLEPRRSAPRLDPVQAILTGSILTSGAGERPPIRSHTVLPNLGNPTTLHLQYAEQLRDALPDSIKTAAREPLSAVALIFALLITDEASLRALQLAEIGKRLGQDVADRTAALYPDVAATARHARLPVVNLAIGGLRNLSSDQFKRFSDALQWLINSDGRTELFEFVLQKIVLHHLGPKFGGTRPASVEYYTFKPLVPDAVVVLSALAYAGSEDSAEIQKAFEAGAPYLRVPPDVDYGLLPREQCGVAQIGPALDRLVLAVPIIKKNLITASVQTIGADGVIKEAEAELLRAIADTLDCPIPPLGVEG